MKILQIADYYDGSTGNPIAVMTKKLSERGNEVTVLTSNISEKGKFENNEKFQVIRCWGFKLGNKAFIPSMKLKLLLRKEKIVHTHVLGFFSTFLSALFKFRKYKLFLTPDFDIRGEKPKGLKKIYYRLFFDYPLKKADVILPFTEMEKKELHERFGIPREKMKVLHIGIDFEKFREKPKIDWRKKLGLEKKFTIINVCFLHEKKNIELTLKALAELKKQNKDFAFVHCGGIINQRYMDKIGRLSKELGLEKNIIFLGRKNLEEIIDVYKCADVFVQTSFRESYCIPILEAMAAGLPIVSTNTGIASEIVENGRTGFIAENETEISKRLIELMDLKFRENISKNCIETAKKFDWEKIIDELEDVYRKN